MTLFVVPFFRISQLLKNKDMSKGNRDFGPAWRKHLLGSARGEVLELFVGEGTNFKYYPPGVRVTAMDVSPKIIEVAKREAAAHHVPVKFIVSPFAELNLEPGEFDTVVSTFSLSNCDEPVMILNRIHDWCKPGGNILLMENGLSSCSLIRWMQTRCNKYHYSRTGSRLDQDIHEILKQSMVQVKKVERKMGGIIWLVWATPDFANSIELVLQSGSDSDAA
jgi:SAM-dependent methyltransferase